MSLTINIEPYVFNQSSKFLNLIERIRQCLREREISREQTRRKTYSILHYIEHLKRCVHENPLIARALFRFYNTIQNFSSPNHHFPSTIISEKDESKMSFEEKISVDHFYRMNEDIDLESDLSKSSLTTSQLMKSTTQLTQSLAVPRQTSGLMTKTTFTAINKTPRQRTTSDIEALEHLLNRCESLRHLPVNVRHYAARSLLFLTYQPHTILTRQNSPSFLVYIIASGQCQFLLETNQTTIFGQQLNMGDIYGDDFLQGMMEHRFNGLITQENNRCNLIGFFPRDIRAYENYLSDMMRQSLLEQLRTQATFLAIQWRKDLRDYFFKWTSYKQYLTDQIIYGNENIEHQNLYFILQGQVSFVRLLELPSMAIRYPEFYQKMIKAKKTSIRRIDLDNNSNSRENIRLQKSTPPNKRTTWRFLEIFLLSHGHYFGFESTTTHSWYLTRSTVDLISIPKNRFKDLGSFAPMIFEKLRQDFLDIYPSELLIRNAYIKHLQINQSNELSSTQFQSLLPNKHDQHLRQTINSLPEQTILNQYKANLSQSN